MCGEWGNEGAVGVLTSCMCVFVFSFDCLVQITSLVIRAVFLWGKDWQRIRL